MELTYDQLNERILSESDMKSSFMSAVLAECQNEASKSQGKAPKDLITLKPIVLCLFGDGGKGKTTFASVMKQHGIKIIHTDEYFKLMRSEAKKMSQEKRSLLQRIIVDYHELNIGCFINRIEKNIILSHQYAENFVKKYFTECNFGMCVVEGYLHKPQRDDAPIESKVIELLKNASCKVWVSQKM